MDTPANTPTPKTPKPAAPKAPKPPGTKRCSSCRRDLPVEDFGHNCQTPDGLSYYCRDCTRDKQREYRDKHPEAATASRKRYLEKLRARNRAARGLP